MTSIDSSAAGWEKWDPWYRVAFAPFMTWACDAAAIGPGLRVLDLACGTGQPALLAAARVGPGGAVAAVDTDEEMLGVARRLARAQSVDHIDFRPMNAQALDFPDGSFDAVTVAFGLMFFPDPVAAMREALRVLVPGGRVAAVVWGLPEENPFLTTLFTVLAEHGHMPAPAAGSPGPYRLAADGALQGVLADAGFEDIEGETLSVDVDSESLARHFEMVHDMATPLRRALQAGSPADRARLREDVERALSAHLVEDRVKIRATTRCAAGRRPQASHDGHGG